MHFILDNVASHYATRKSNSLKNKLSVFITIAVVFDAQHCVNETTLINEIDADRTEKHLSKRQFSLFDSKISQEIIKLIP